MLPKAQQAHLEQVRQVDEKTVVAFLVLPGHAFRPIPGATPDVAISLDGTPGPGTEAYDLVSFLVFEQRDGEWQIDYLSNGMVTFSDVVPND